MDKVKINSITGNLVNATFTFDDASVPNLTVNLNDMTICDGDILAEELNDYGQKYKSDCLARIPSQAVAGAVGMEFGFVDGVIVPIIPETPVVPEEPIAPETPENP
jgi:hypothetical protein